jgi:hypothetical protein
MPCYFVTVHQSEDGREWAAGGVDRVLEEAWWSSPNIPLDNNRYNKYYAPVLETPGGGP